MMLRTRPVRRLVLSAAAISLGLLASATPSSAATPPAAPSGLTATFTTGAMTLRWTDNATDETGFVVERCITADCVTAGRIATVGANSTSYVDTYYTTGNLYRVTAVNAAGASAGSNLASSSLFNTGDVTARATASVVSGQAPLTVAFDASASIAINGTVTIWSWSFGDDQTASGVTTSHTFTTPGVYATRMRATATGGPFGTPSATAVVLITVTAPPVTLTAPTNLVATSPSRGRVNLAWTNPAATTATTVRVERCRGASCTNFTRLATVSLAATSYVDTTGSRGTTYSYRVAASNGTSTVYSNRVTVTVRN